MTSAVRDVTVCDEHLPASMKFDINERTRAAVNLIAFARHEDTLLPRRFVGRAVLRQLQQQHYMLREKCSARSGRGYGSKFDFD